MDEKICEHPDCNGLQVEDDNHPLPAAQLCEDCREIVKVMFNHGKLDELAQLATIIIEARTDDNG